MSGAKFDRGDRVEKISGSSWRGRVVGTYSTDLTPEGYAVESDTEKGSVQIYPAKALRLATPSQRLDAATVEREGSFACPICGQDTPHHHTPEVVDAYQNKRSRK